MWGMLAAALISTAAMASTPGPDSLTIASSAPSVRPGDLMVLTITASEPLDRLQLHAFNREIPTYRVDAMTWRGLVGIDLAVRPGSAPNAGRVVIARDLYFSGNTVVLDHGLGLYSLLAHLSEIDVRAGGARVDPLSVLAVLESATPR